jgi:hypothetical protein
VGWRVGGVSNAAAAELAAVLSLTKSRSQVSAVYQATLAASFIDAYNSGMYHYNPSTALEELTEEATLPNPVHVRDMMLRHKLTADEALELNRIFLEYQKFFGETQKLGKEILKRLAG